jgi:phenylacetate-CoA ligase
MQELMIETLSFKNEAFDYMPRNQLNQYLLHRIRDQFVFMKNNVPFYKKRYANIDVSSLKTIDDCVSKIPGLRKNDIRNLPSPYDLLPTQIRENMSKIYLYRGTGGTTGEPTSMFYSYNDWRAIVHAMVRSLKELREIAKETQIIAFNGYNQGHISGPIFDDTIRELGGISIARHFTADDERALRQMARHKCNLIICPPTSTHKGGTLEELLKADVKTGLNYINGDNIIALFLSSTPTTPELMKEIKELGIKLVYNYYGSTDVLPTAISCQESPETWHILNGHISLFVVDENQGHVKNGERGLVIASRIGSYDKNGKISNCEATQLLNYYVGDEVTYIDEPCKCGRTTPRIADIKRVLDIRDKIESGCEAW